ncbi:MAG: glucuronate isomerase [Clostridia bacterium]|nr:glucuronate isomerase [Clostridia bacterium]
MNENYLLKTQNARQLYFEAAANLPIIDFHNHISVSDLAYNKSYDNVYELWLKPDPYKHRLMRICGIPEFYITGDAEPYEKFLKFCSIFPMLAGNPVYDWSRMELLKVFGISDLPTADNPEYLWSQINEKLCSPEFSAVNILKRFNIEYQSPVATLLDDLTLFNGKDIVPSLRGDNLLSPDNNFLEALKSKTGIEINNTDSYIKAICVVLDEFTSAGCKFADHSLDFDFFEKSKNSLDILKLLSTEYAKRGWTLLLHIGAKRETSTKLRDIAGPAGGYAATSNNFPLSKLVDFLGEVEAEGTLPDTVIFPLNMSDQAPASILQGSFSEDNISSKVQLGPAWWWCDHSLGIKNTLSCISSFGAVSQFIGMTTDSRSILSFVRHDYFRRILCNWLDTQNTAEEWELPFEQQKEIIKKICYENAKLKIKR